MNPQVVIAITGAIVLPMLVLVFWRLALAGAALLAMLLAVAGAGVGVVLWVARWEDRLSETAQLLLLAAVVVPLLWYGWPRAPRSARRLGRATHDAYPPSL